MSADMMAYSVHWVTTMLYVCVWVGLFLLALACLGWLCDFAQWLLDKLEQRDG